MSRPIPSRKRAAPGASPIIQQPEQQQYAAAQPTQPSDEGLDSFIDWADPIFSLQNPGNVNQSSYNTGGFPNAGFNGDIDASNVAPSMSVQASQNAGQLVRRNANQQLARQARGQWEMGGVGVQAQPAAWEVDEDDVELEQRALEAKKDAQSKRKQIPPFVQKLSSFLDESRNTDLIRWSDSGLSFIVLDEDEFAKTLIPELFKHNNYASFVRQLNMYGFHKKVGLSDNSMKTSELKRKTPSEYSNKYFRRGRPELLWLIQKPKNAPTGKKTQDGKGADNEEEGGKKASNWTASHQAEEVPDNQDLAVISKTELDSLRQELVQLKQQNKLISSWISGMKRQNEQMYQQAASFQLMHDRHESSINAILTFLATFYNRSISGQNNFPDMFNGAIPQQGSQSGNVVEMPDYSGMDFSSMGGPNLTPNRSRRPLLLPAPESKPVNAASPATLPSTAAASPHPRNQQTPASWSSAASVTAQSPAVKVDVETPDITSEMMSVINAANATSPAGAGINLDFNSALEHMQTADGNTPLTHQQRTDMLHQLSAVANSTAASTSSPANASGSQAAAPVTSPGGTPNMETPSFLNSPLPPLNLQAIGNQREHLDYVQKLQEDQATKMQSLAEKLGPLSPNGQIPGFNDGQNVPPADFNLDLDEWLNLNNNNYFPPDAGLDDGMNFFGTAEGDSAVPDSTSAVGASEDPFGGDADGRVESVSSKGVSPAATVETVDADDADEIEQGDSSKKKRRRYL